MKRKFIKQFKMLYSFYPILFWYKCNKCKNEFRREKAWRALGVPIRNSELTTYYLCNGCAPTHEIADEYFLSEKYLGDFRTTRPPSPSRPPAPHPKDRE